MPSMLPIPASTAPAAGAGLPVPLDADGVARLRQVVLRLARRLRRHADSGATLEQMSALAAIARRGPVSLGELAAAEHVAPSTITKVVGALEGADLVSRDTDPADRRVALASVTPAGRALLERSRSSAASYLAERVSTLDPHDAAALAAALPALERLVGEGRVRT